MSLLKLMDGVFRIEAEMGENRLCLYLLREERTLLIDSGVRTTPDEVLYPALRGTGLPLELDLLLVSHADADHHGGNAAIRSGSPNVVILSHERDRAWIESKAFHLRGRYDEVVVADDEGYSPEIMDWLANMIGPDTRVDVGLSGGETLGLGAGVRYEVLHTPGHTAGHLSLWNPERRIMIVQDAVLGRGVPDRRGVVSSPPPYVDVAAYLDTVGQLQALEPEWLLTAHFPVMRGAEVGEFFATSVEFVTRLDAAVMETVLEAGRPPTLKVIIDGVDARLGPFATRIQWIGPTLAHLQRHARDGRLWVGREGGHRTWGAA